MLELRVSLFLCAVLLGGCDSRAEARTSAESQPTPAAAVATPAAAPATAAPTTSPAPASPALDPSRGAEIGAVYEAFMTPHQEGDEEENTPASTPKQFRSTTPSQSRAEREAAGHRGHGQLRFSNDFSRVFIDVKIEGIDPKTINMFHIHCGKPGILGPILVDFSHATDLQSNIADSMFSVEIRNEHLTKTVEHAHGLVGAFTTGCIIPSPSLGAIAPTKVSTVAGMAQLARDGELYFNLHTTGQTYFGDIRGQIHPAGAH
ncbi:CHRD domain-containing protein [Nannocystis sp. SCPEA4]|nr:CHRD domain-containing protein [Nannocystis sp. SCPEA4]